MPMKLRCIIAVLLAIGVSGTLALGESRADRPAGTTTSTVSSGAVSATVTTTGSSNVILLTSTTAHDGRMSTCIQIAVDDLWGEFCEEAPSAPLTYQCDLTSDLSGMHGTCICQSSTPDLPPQACAGLEEGCVQLGGEIQETAEGKLCAF